jgi:hypothetical protein
MREMLRCSSLLPSIDFALVPRCVAMRSIICSVSRAFSHLILMIDSAAAFAFEREDSRRPRSILRLYLVGGFLPSRERR